MACADACERDCTHLPSRPCFTQFVADNADRNLTNLDVKSKFHGIQMLAVTFNKFYGIRMLAVTTFNKFHGIGMLAVKTFNKFHGMRVLAVTSFNKSHGIGILAVTTFKEKLTLKSLDRSKTLLETLEV